MIYEWRQLSTSVNIDVSKLKRQYGEVKLPSGRTIHRNYGRELKSGKGKTFADLIEGAAGRSAAALRDAMGIPLWS